MIRFLNALALIAVISSATWAYSVKYETILVAEKLKKREAELVRERDAVAILEAEWNLLNRAERMASLAKPETGMQQLSARQVVKPGDIPMASAVTSDRIDALLTGSLALPDAARKTPAKAAGTTPATPARSGQTGKPVQRSPTTAAVTAAPKPGQPVKTTAALSLTKAGAGAPKAVASTAAKATGPIRLAPPAKVGVPQAASAPPVALAPEAKPSNPITGLLNKLIR
jgi:hypothetical protein